MYTVFFVNTKIAGFAVPYAHPGFQNIDTYAERCLACVVRKLKNNLRGLQVLYRYRVVKTPNIMGSCPKEVKCTCRVELQKREIIIYLRVRLGKDTG